MSKTAATGFWLMKTEPDTFSFDDLIASARRTTHWEGVRNYQARNFMRDDFRLGDQVFIYHSRVKDPAIVGVAKVVKMAYPDPTALDPSHPYFDPKSGAKGESRWVMVDVRATGRLKNPVTISQIRKTSGLEDMLVIRKGMRLSIQPVVKAHWQLISRLGAVEDL